MEGQFHKAELDPYKNESMVSLVSRRYMRVVNGSLDSGLSKKRSQPVVAVWVYSISMLI